MRMLRLGPGLALGIVYAFLLTSGDAVGAAQKDRAKPSARLSPSPVPTAYKAVKSGSSLPVRDLPRETKVPDPSKVLLVPNDPGDVWEPPERHFTNRATPDGARQPAMPTAEGGPPPPPSPIVNVQGISQLTQGQVSSFFVSPPDTVGDVGPNHYVQCVNLACQIFDKSGAAASPVFLLKTLFTSIGGACDDGDKGDPIVLYDPLADRWMLSQFGWAGATTAPPAPPFHECVAVSQTGDPTGAYHLYDFVIPNGYFNDYPKFGVWPDGYYMTAPLFGGPVFGQGAFVMNRAKMLVGDPAAEMIFFDLTLSHPGLQRLLPADTDGVPPPAGTPNYMATLTADEFGDAQDGIRLFEVRPDFGNPAASTFTELPPLAVASFDPSFTEVSGTCGAGVNFDSRDDIDQPPPAACNHRVDAIANRPMHRLAYRNFGTHESLVLNHTVDANATPPTAPSGHLAGIRYYELRRSLPAGSFGVQEQATFAPDTIHRWMGSAAIDAQGNIAVGYSVSDVTSTFPGVRFASRLASDPPGGLFQGETTLAAGGRSQTTTSSRWGDYSAMSVDPADECTFWYTQEYYDATWPGAPPCSTTACWQTRIGSFKFPSCVSSTALGTLQGTVTDAGTLTPIAGVLVQANGYSAVTDGLGAYSMSIAAGTYTVTAAKSGYGTASAAGVVVTGSGTTVQDFSLGSGSIAGTITNSLTSGPIGGALVTVTGGAHALTDGSGNYSIPLPAGTYDVSVSASNFFPNGLTGQVVGTSGVTPVNLALTPAPIVNVSATAVDDSIGNNNGAVDYGDCFRLTVTLVNSATVSATAITATLTTGTAGVVIGQPTSAYPDLAAGGGTGANTTPFELTANPDPASAGKPIALTLNLATASGALSVPFNLLTGGGGPPLTVSVNGPVAIPDNNAGGATLSIPVSGFTGTLSKVKVSVRITHTYDGDLILALIGPDDTIVTLASNVGADGAGFGTDCPAGANDTTFDDAASIAISGGTAPFVGSFRPQEPLYTFGGKSGAQVNGDWRFLAVDVGPVDIGNIECVTLTLNGDQFGGCTPTDLSITKTDGQTTFEPGQVLDYTIVATNNGPTTATGATVTDTFPVGLTGVTWTCVGGSGGACGSASGSGDINATVDLPAGGTATFAVSATVVVSPPAAIANTAAIVPPAGVADTVPANNTATDSDTLSGQLYTLTPCRLIDTRNPDGPLGGPALVAGANRTFQVTGNCGIPADATAVVLNVTVVSSTAGGNLRIFPTGAAVPTVSALNYSTGQTRGNNGIFALGGVIMLQGPKTFEVGGKFDIRCQQASGSAHVIVDVTGYFVE